MAKKISSAKTRNSARAAEARFKLYYPVLAGCEFERNGLPEDASEADKAERFYDSTMEMSEEQDDTLKVAICEFSAGQKVKETKILEIRATYFVGLKLGELRSELDSKSALQEMVATSAWPMFRDLFIHIASQSGEELPLLPNVPKLRWLEGK